MTHSLAAIQSNTIKAWVIKRSETTRLHRFGS